MSQPYVGEIRMFGGNFAPAGWEFCQGQLLAIAEFETLFNLIGTTYGGDGQSTFALPDLQSRVPIHQGTGSGGIGNYTLAQTGGVEQVTLTVQQLPIHNHSLTATNSGQTQIPTAATIPAVATSTKDGIAVYGPPVSPTTLNPSSITSAGGSLPHDNRQPYLVVNFIISLFGIFPSQN
jgi:microcystin-dependent protein